MIEVLIVVAIIGILSVALFASFRSQKQKAQDAKQISDINRLKTAFEDYYNDHGCYPPATWFDNVDDCGGDMLAPYLNVIPCQTDGTPYRLTTDTTGCKAFQLGAFMQHPVENLVCYQNTNFCSSSANFNATIPIAPPLAVIGAPSSTPIASSTLAPSSTAAASSTATPTSTPTINYYCSAVGNCTSNMDPFITCNPGYPNDPYCGNTGCPSIGTCH